MASDMKLQAVGRRKSSVARVTLSPGNGQWTVNGRAIEDYFPRPSHQTWAAEPLVVTGTNGRMDVRVTVNGGGNTGQAGAVRLGIARALLKYDDTLRVAMREKGMLTRDPREVERKKPGRAGARKRFQFSKR
jgi:small subunit ribosomal protein S9